MELVEIETQVKKSVREGDFESLYRGSFPSVARFVRKMNGSSQDAADIFHDALIIYHEKSQQGKLSIDDSPEAYLLGIAKHLWIRKFNRDKRFVSLTDADQQITIPSDYFPSANAERLLLFLEKTGKKCLDLLHAFYFEKKNLTELSGSFHYQHEHSVSVQKYKCIEKLRDLIKEKSISYEDFTD